MHKKSVFNPESINNLVKFLDQNKASDFQKLNLQSEEGITSLNFKHLTKKKEELISLSKAFQRLIRIIPEQNREAALTLLTEGVHSALQIAKMTRKEFMGKFARLLNDEKLADAIYQNALKKRGIILLQYLDVYQNNEPHIKAALFS
jgi:hypothetical protein